MNVSYLYNAKLKNTKNRTKILTIFEKTTEPLCAEDIYIKVNKEINIATIYRNLNTLTDKRILSKAILNDGKMYYKLNVTNHKHNLICNICHNIKPIENCPIDLISKNIKDTTGYEITNHKLEIQGICPECQTRLKR